MNLKSLDIVRFNSLKHWTRQILDLKREIPFQANKHQLTVLTSHHSSTPSQAVEAGNFGDGRELHRKQYIIRMSPNKLCLLGCK